METPVTCRERRLDLLSNWATLLRNSRIGVEGNIFRPVGYAHERMKNAGFGAVGVLEGTDLFLLDGDIQDHTITFLLLGGLAPQENS